LEFEFFIFLLHSINFLVIIIYVVIINCGKTGFFFVCTIFHSGYNPIMDHFKFMVHAELFLVSASSHQP